MDNIVIKKLIGGRLCQTGAKNRADGETEPGKKEKRR